MEEDTKQLLLSNGNKHVSSPKERRFQSESPNPTLRNGFRRGSGGGSFLSGTASLLQPNKKARNLLALGLMGFVIFFSFYFYGRTVDAGDYNHYYDLLSKASAGDGCRIPKPDPWDETIQKYLKTPTPIVCKKLQTELTYMDNQGWLHFNDSARIADGYGALTCQYRCFWRNEGVDDVNLVLGEWTTFSGKTKPKCEFVEVSCSRPFPTISVYSNLHNQIVIKEDRLREVYKLLPKTAQTRSMSPQVVASPAGASSTTIRTESTNLNSIKNKGNPGIQRQLKRKTVLTATQNSDQRSHTSSNPKISKGQIGVTSYDNRFPFQRLKTSKIRRMPGSKQVNEKTIQRLEKVQFAAGHSQNDTTNTRFKRKTDSFDSNLKLETPSIQPPSDPPPGVLIFVLDSVSYSNARRYLPKLLNVLRDDYGAVEFEGYAKVGDNSFPNAAAFLTGKRAHVAGYKDELKDMSKEFYDSWPIVWKDFANKGYLTLYAEDYPDYNLFTYLANGFQRQPVDHFFRPFWIQVWKTFLHRRSSHLCFGNSPKLDFQLNYLRQFLGKYQGWPLFGLSWLTELGHDWLNQVELGDEDLAMFFQQMKPFLSNTFLFVMSDHGHRFDKIRESLIGRIEERMPMFTVAIPPKIRKKYPQMDTNLRANSKALTSHFDLYVTLIDILRSGNKWSNFGKQQQWSPPISSRGLSIFRPIPKNRSCRDAGITEDFCVCQYETTVNVTDPMVQRGGELVVAHVNKLLKDHRNECAPLVLSSIMNAQTFLPNIKMINDPSVSVFYRGSNPSGFFINYRVTVETSPSGAILEGTLRNSIHEKSFEVFGDVNRINKYGNQSICIKSAFLRKYCYCNQ